MRAARNYAVLGFLLLLPFTLGVLLVSDVLALQRGDVVIDGRVTITVEVAQTAREQARGSEVDHRFQKVAGCSFPLTRQTFGRSG